MLSEMLMEAGSEAAHGGAFPIESLLGLVVAGAVVFVILGILNLKRADDE